MAVIKMLHILFVTYAFWMTKLSLKTVFFFCKIITKSLKNHYQKAPDLFENRHMFITESDFDWEKCIDRARSMSDRYGGIQALIRKKVSHAMWAHCISHREALEL